MVPSLLSPGGHGGSLAAYGSFLAVVNSTFQGLNVPPPQAHPAQPLLAPTAPVGAQYGGCIAVTTSRLYVQGSSFQQCASFSLGGSLFAFSADAVILNSTIVHSRSQQVSGGTQSADRDQDVTEDWGEGEAATMAETKRALAAQQTTSGSHIVQNKLFF